MFGSHPRMDQMQEDTVARCLFISWFKGQSVNPEIKDNDDFESFVTSI